MQEPIAKLAESRCPASHVVITLMAILSFVSFTLHPQSVRADDTAPVRHSFLGVGKANKVVIVGESGKID